MVPLRLSTLCTQSLNQENTMRRIYIWVVSVKTGHAVVASPRVSPQCSQNTVMRELDKDRQALARLPGLLNTYVVLAGLLTAATYPAIYGTRELGCTDAQNAGNTMHLGCPWVSGLGDLFRALNVISLSLSLAVLIQAAGVLVVYQSGFAVARLTHLTHTRAFWLFGTNLMPASLIMSAALAFAAVVVASIGFLPYPISVVCMVLAAIVALVVFSWIVGLWLSCSRKGHVDDLETMLINCCIATTSDIKQMRVRRVRPAAAAVVAAMVLAAVAEHMPEQPSRDVVDGDDDVDNGRQAALEAAFAAAVATHAGATAAKKGLERLRNPDQGLCAGAGGISAAAEAVLVEPQAQGGAAAVHAYSALLVKAAKAAAHITHLDNRSESRFKAAATAAAAAAEPVAADDESMKTAAAAAQMGLTQAH